MPRLLPRRLTWPVMLVARTLRRGNNVTSPSSLLDISSWTSQHLWSPSGGERRWTVRLLGAIQAHGTGEGAVALERWPSRAVAALLARLAMAPDRVHPREEIVELLWPGVALDVGRNRLRQVLSTLKGLLEPAGASPHSVLRADRLGLSLMPGAIDSDVRMFERLLRAGQLQGASELYRGELMPGHYEDWVVEERHRLAGLHERLQELLSEGVNGRPAESPQESPRESAKEISHAGPLDRSRSDPASGLPNYWTRPFGAEANVDRLCASVRAHRLVTVHGPGGSGKTRLAVQAARVLLGNEHGGAVAASSSPAFERITFVSLVDCTDAAQALDALCAALQVPAGSDPRARIVAALDSYASLLVLDNLEQLVDTAGTELAHLLAGAPLLHLLVTSRRLLELDGENAFELEGLPLPDDDAAAQTAQDNAAVALFLDRARAARADFRVGPRNVSAVVGLVRLLGGMPLAIELAASRLRSLTPQELLQRLSEDVGTPMLDLLARGGQRPGADARHASMRHVVAWSWQQLNEQQVALMQALSVLAAPARLEAIAALAQQTPRRVQSLLIDLHDASLVIRQEGDDDITRYALLQPVREFAAEHVSVEQARLARAHLREWLTTLARSLLHTSGAAVSPTVRAEIAHVHAAIVSAQQDEAAQQALRLAVVLRPHWDNDNLPLTTLQAMENLLPAVAKAGLRSSALELLAQGRLQAGFAVQALAHAEAALAAASDDRMRAMAHMRIAWVKVMTSRFDASCEPGLKQAWALAQACGDLYAQGHTLRAMALVACNVHLEFAQAEDLMTQAQTLWEGAGNHSLAQLSLLGRVSMWAWMGRNLEALPVFHECEQAARQRGDWMLQHVTARQMGRVHLRVRDGPAAAAAFVRSVGVAWQRRFVPGIVHGLIHLPEALMTHVKGANPAPPTRATLEAAARLQGFSVSHWQRLYGDINRIETRELCRARRLLRLHLGPARLQMLLTEGAALGLADAVREGLGLQ